MGIPRVTLRLSIIILCLMAVTEALVKPLVGNAVQVYQTMTIMIILWSGISTPTDLLPRLPSTVFFGGLVGSIWSLNVWLHTQFPAMYGAEWALAIPLGTLGWLIGIEGVTKLSALAVRVAQAPREILAIWHHPQRSSTSSTDTE